MECYFPSWLAPSTDNSYDLAKCTFLCFCIPALSNPLSVSESFLCRYIAYLAEESLAPKTLTSAVHHLQVAMTLSDPKIGEMPQVMKVQNSNMQRETLTRENDCQSSQSFCCRWSRDPKNFDNVMLWAACCSCFFGFLQSGEATISSEAAYDGSIHLNMSDMAVDSTESPSTIKMHQKQTNSGEKWISTSGGLITNNAQLKRCWLTQQKEERNRACYSNLKISNCLQKTGSYQELEKPYLSLVSMKSYRLRHSNDCKL